MAMSLDGENARPRSILRDPQRIDEVAGMLKALGHPRDGRKRIVILGAGTAGTMMANRLARALPERDWRITVVDRDDLHLYQPGLLFLPFGAYREEELIRPRRKLLDARVEARLAE